MEPVEVKFADDGGIAKSCSRCGAPFSCGRDLPSCWCSGLPLLDEAAIDPAADCLCPECLAHLTATTAPPPSSENAP